MPVNSNGPAEIFMVGRVVSTKMNKTAVVLVESKKTHPLYGKSYAWSKKYLVDDQLTVGKGDIVIFQKVRPVSKRKHWQITKVLGKDIVSLEQAELAEEAAEAIAEVLPEEKEEVIGTEAGVAGAADDKAVKKTRRVRAGKSKEAES